MAQCKARVWENFHDYQCRNKGTTAEGFCASHDPKRREARREKKRAEVAARRAPYEKAAEVVKDAAKRLGLVHPDQAAWTAELSANRYVVAMRPDVALRLVAEVGEPCPACEDGFPIELDRAPCCGRTR